MNSDDTISDEELREILDNSDNKINHLWAYVVEVAEGEGLIFAGDEDSGPKYPAVPLVTHTSIDLDELSKIAEKLAEKTGCTLVLYKYSHRQRIRSFPRRTDH